MRRHREGGEEHLAKDEIRNRTIFNTKLKPIYSHLEGAMEGISDNAVGSAEGGRLGKADDLLL